MNPLLFALLLGLLIGVFLSFNLFSRPLERNRIVSYEFPEGWSKNLYHKLPLSFELSEKTKGHFFKKIQSSLSDKDFFPLGQKELEGLDCVFICAPFLLFDSHNTRPLNGLKRFLIVDETYQGKNLPKEEGHDLTLFYTRNTSRIHSSSLQPLASKTQKALVQLFGESLAKSYNQGPIFQTYAQKYNKRHLFKALDRLTPILKKEFYLSEEIDEELLIWKLHEILCYSPKEFSKALPQTYQAFIAYYKL